MKVKVETEKERRKGKKIKAKLEGGVTTDTKEIL